jgi:hypothetical protein
LTSLTDDARADLTGACNTQQEDEQGRPNYTEINVFAFAGLNRIVFPHSSAGSKVSTEKKIKLLADKEDYSPGTLCPLSRPVAAADQNTNRNYAPQRRNGASVGAFADLAC